MVFLEREDMLEIIKMEINKELNLLYQSKWELISKNLQEVLVSESVVKPTNPLLLKIGDEHRYLKSDIRLMILGQETNDWGGNFGGNIEYIQSIYDEFFNTGRCFSYGGQFWNGIGRFLTLIKQKYPNKSIEFVWNNVVKIGKSNAKGIPPHAMYKIEQELFSVLEREVDILKPNLILFLSGPNYDGFLRDQFPSISFEEIKGFATRQLTHVKIHQVDYSFRTYHPNYLWRKGINNYFNAILEQINF